MEWNPFRKREFDPEAGVDEDMASVVVNGLHRVRGQLDRHTRPLTERLETLSNRGVSVIEAGAGLVAVAGVVGTAVAFIAER